MYCLSSCSLKSLANKKNVLVYMGYLQLVLSAQNSSILDAGILLMVQHVRLMMFSLIMVDYPMSFLLLST